MNTKTNLSARHIMQHFSPDFQRSPAPKMYVFDCLDSTNTWLKDNGDCGVVCIAEQQTAGRGRRGRQWLSPRAENIYCSVKWCFEVTPEQLSLLSLVVGLSIAKALQKIGLTGHGVKWPNDIFWQGEKMGGILIEGISSNSSLHQQEVVIGFGLNVNMPKSSGETIDQPWVSLHHAMGDTLDRNQLLAFILEFLINDLQCFDRLDSKRFQHDWRYWDVLYGQNVLILQEQQERSGIVDGIDDQGRLAVKLMSGQLAYYTSAEIRLKK
ncbi:MAG: biotin--[acetyl-CoA-carboxylase] ligase [Aquificaceae bacterium]|nr:MAG: biotin--[acetyl-CoA-carboxylase] ligase [Aquificaceae bacterium]